MPWNPTPERPAVPEAVRVSPSGIRGRLSPPPSKSAAHRALLCAALAGGGEVRGVLDSQDMQATVGALPALGALPSWKGETVALAPAAPPPGAPAVVDCGESGSTLRFLIPLFAAKGLPAVFTGRGRLPERPLGVYGDCLPPHGVALEGPGGGRSLPLRVSGRLRAGRFSLPGDVSSQFVTGLLLALPLCGGESEIVLTTPLESAAYVTMTVEAMARAGVRAERTPAGWRVPGGQRYRPHSETVEADWSQAAFLLAAGALGGEVRLTGLNPASSQGDREALALFRRFGASVEETAEGLICRRAPLHGIEIDASQIPDLVPVLAVTAALAEGTTRITGAARLRLKESDRLAAVAHCLRLLGGRVEEQADGLTIEGQARLPGGAAVPGCNDHRIVMSMAVAALGCEKPVTITDAGSVRKSWPSFFTDFQKIGGDVHGLEYR
ncbi:MAG TPA: 3-phosphoshikimate 1-carboxyvinyltransferase [Firmicutes bacterium]|nr:3-phosphoshikimate 1-carboxyvinyltransferase [Bacillota bacterium]